jgi:hypothetical protein
LRNYRRVDPVVTVREALEAARRAGVPFGAAWPAAPEAIEDRPPTAA